MSGSGSRARFVLPGGQSGNPFSPHYADQFELWRKGDALPIAWSEPMVQRSTRHTLLLATGGAAATRGLNPAQVWPTAIRGRLMRLHPPSSCVLARARTDRRLPACGGPTSAETTVHHRSPPRRPSPSTTTDGRPPPRRLPPRPRRRPPPPPPSTTGPIAPSPACRSTTRRCSTAGSSPSRWTTTPRPGPSRASSRRRGDRDPGRGRLHPLHRAVPHHRHRLRRADPLGPPHRPAMLRPMNAVHSSSAAARSWIINLIASRGVKHHRRGRRHLPHRRAAAPPQPLRRHRRPAGDRRRPGVLATNSAVAIYAIAPWDEMPEETADTITFSWGSGAHVLLGVRGRQVLPLRSASTTHPQLGRSGRATSSRSPPTSWWSSRAPGTPPIRPPGSKATRCRPPRPSAPDTPDIFYQGHVLRAPGAAATSTAAVPALTTRTAIR